MRTSNVLLTAVALVAAAVVVVVGLQLVSPTGPLLENAAFDRETITPNADGADDIVNFQFTLSRLAEITLTLSPETGTPYAIRTGQRTPAGEYALAFSGVVDGYVLPDETFEAEIQRRLIPDGRYTWTLTAQAVDGDETATQTGTLIVENSDDALPELTGFTISPRIFTPNQDGVADRVSINAYLTKDATVTGYLLDPDGQRFYLIPRELENRSGEVGWQEFDYEGGVDIGAEPPPDGTYTVIVEAQDAVGQRVAVSGELSIRDGGKPRAGILGQGSGADVVFTTLPYEDAFFSDQNGFGTLLAMPDNPADYRLGQVTVPIGDVLVFKLIIENYGTSPIRTAGPPPGTVYQQRQVAAALGAIEQDGVWRVGIQCETSENSYPYRWALGTPETLTAVEDPTSGNVYYYLEPGQRVTVWGGIRLTNANRNINPQQCFAGLIHEGVGISNPRIGARDILIADPEVE